MSITFVGRYVNGFTRNEGETGVTIVEVTVIPNQDAKNLKSKKEIVRKDRVRDT